MTRVIAATLHVYFKAPADFHGDGLFIGGGYFPLKDGILKLPAEGSYLSALPEGFVQVTGPKIPGETEDPPVVGSQEAADSLQISSGLPGGADGEPAVLFEAANPLAGNVPDGGGGTETVTTAQTAETEEADRADSGAKADGNVGGAEHIANQLNKG